MHYCHIYKMNEEESSVLVGAAYLPVIPRIGETFHLMPHKGEEIDGVVKDILYSFSDDIDKEMDYYVVLYIV